MSSAVKISSPSPAAVISTSNSNVSYFVPLDSVPYMSALDPAVTFLPDQFKEFGCFPLASLPLWYVALNVYVPALSAWNGTLMMLPFSNQPTFCPLLALSSATRRTCLPFSDVPLSNMKCSASSCFVLPFRRGIINLSSSVYVDRFVRLFRAASSFVQASA
ncbi:hypothetical protein HMPREF1026_01857 [Lachnospiraceae bacterium 8_1_57FAA]|nr:hypothetical protein HMPREF1026_01857 [Lachnospiraceae bacterium 8_1_57FAA]